MRRFCGLIMVCALCAGMAVAGNAELVGYWPLNEGQGQAAHDGSGNGNHGSLSGGAKWVAGRHGKALEFDGATGHVAIAPQASLNLSGDATLMAWIKTVTDEGRDHLIFGDGAGLGKDRNLSMGLDLGKLYILHGNGTDAQTVHNDVPFDGVWRHVAVVYSFPAYTLYVDGKEVDRGKMDFPVTPTQGGPRYIGGWAPGRFKGVIDDVRLYKGAMTGAEVRAAMAAEAESAWSAAEFTVVKPPEPLLMAGETDLIGYWPFDEGNGMAAHDASPLGHHGTVKGGAVWVRGVRGNALRFNGADSLVEISGAKALNVTGDMTFEAWVRTTSDIARDRLIYGDGASLAVNRNVSIGLDRGGLFIGRGNDAGYEQVLTDTVFKGKWKHIAVVFESPRCYVYVDGRIVAVHPMAFPVTATQGGARFIGGWWAGWFKGDIDEVRLYKRGLSEAEIVNHYRLNAVDTTPVARLFCSHVFSSKEIRGEVLCTGVSDAKLTATVSLVKADAARPLATTTCELNATRPGGKRALGSVRLSAEGVAPGEYSLRAEVRNRAGKVILTGEQPLTLPARPAWLGSREGTEDWLPPPFTPVQARATNGTVDVDVWGRRYAMAGAPFLRRVVTQGADALASPMRLVAQVDGRDVAWTPSAQRLDSQSQTHAVVSRGFTGGALRFSSVVRTDYDGFVRVDWTIRKPRAARLTGLRLEVPFKRDFATYLYSWPTEWEGGGGYSGALKASHAMPFKPIVWLGNERAGLSWFCESDANWAPAEAGEAITVTRRKEDVLLRFNLISGADALKDADSVTYTFAFHATPVKAITKTGWDYRITSTPWYGYDYDLLTDRAFQGLPAMEYFRKSGMRTLLTANWTTVLAYPGPLGHADKFRKLVNKAHAYGMKVMPYLGYQISDAAPECKYLRGDVVVMPLLSNPDCYPGTESQNVNTVCLKSLWQDALVDGVAKMMDEYDIDGVYLDSTNMPFGCLNELHGCGYRAADGVLRKTYPIFAVRETFQRLYKVVKRRKPDGIVDSHVWDCMNSSSLSFATTYWTGEQLGSTGSMSNLPLDRFRTEMMGVNWGVPSDFLHYILGDFRKAHALTLPHDVPVRTYQGEYPLTVSIWRLMEDFGRHEARFLPYWNNAEAVQLAAKGCVASVYQHPENGVLLIVSNPTGEAAQGDLTLNPAALGLAGKTLVAVDGLSREPVPMNKARVAISLPSLGWKYVWIKPQ